MRAAMVGDMGPGPPGSRIIHSGIQGSRFENGVSSCFVATALNAPSTTTAAHTSAPTSPLCPIRPCI